MPGALELGPAQGRIMLRTFREGLAAQVGHDLVLRFDTWSARVTLPEGGQPAAIEARIDLTSLRVVEGTGGMKPLTDRDRREIAANARKALATEYHPDALYRSTGFTATDGGGFVDGVLSLHGAERPLRLVVTRLEGGRCRAEASIRQSDHGVKPYTAFFGALKLRDAVELEVEVQLEGEAGGIGEGAGAGTPA